MMPSRCSSPFQLQSKLILCSRGAGPSVLQDFLSRCIPHTNVPAPLARGDDSLNPLEKSDLGSRHQMPDARWEETFRRRNRVSALRRRNLGALVGGLGKMGRVVMLPKD